MLIGLGRAVSVVNDLYSGAAALALFGSKRSRSEGHGGCGGASLFRRVTSGMMLV